MDHLVQEISQACFAEPLHGHSESPSPSARLESLPNEVLDEICRLVALYPSDLDSIDAHEKRPVDSDRDNQPSHWHPLYGFYLASRRLYAIAKPHFYRGIVLSDPLGLTLLFRALIEDPSLGTSVEYLDNKLCLSSRDTIRIVKEDFNQRFADHGITPDVIEFERFSSLQRVPQWTEDFQPSEIPQGLFFAVLCLLPNLRCLVLRTDFDGFYPYLAQCVEYINEHDYRNSFLRKLEVLIALPRDRGKVSVSVCLPSFMAILNFSRLELAWDDGFWDDLPLDEDNSPINPFRVEHLKLVRSSCTPSDMYEICRFFPALKSLHIDVEESAGTHHLYPVLDGCFVAGRWVASSENLNDGLLLLKDTLEHLYLRLNYRIGVGPLVGRDYQVTCLPQMKKLKSVSIEPKQYVRL